MVLSRKKNIYNAVKKEQQTGGTYDIEAID